MTGAVLASFDTTPGQVTADALLLVLLGVNIYLGFRFGLMRRFLGFIGLYVGCLAATNIGNPIASAIRPGSVEANGWAFLAVLAFVVIVTEVLGFLVNDHIQRIAVVFFDRAAGTIAGAFIGLCEALLVFLVAYAVAAAPAGNALASRDHAAPADAIQASMFSGQVARATGTARAVFSAVLPDNLAKHLSDGTRLDTPPF